MKNIFFKEDNKVTQFGTDTNAKIYIDTKEGLELLGSTFYQKRAMKGETSEVLTWIKNNSPEILEGISFKDDYIQDNFERGYYSWQMKDKLKIEKL